MSAGSLVVTLWRPAGTSPRMSPGPTIADYKKVEGYATPCVLFRVSAVIVKSVGSVKFSIKAKSSSQQVHFQTSIEERKESASQTFIDICRYCDLPCHVMMIVRMTVNVADVHGAGSVRTKLRPTLWVVNAAHFLSSVYICLIFRALTQYTG